MKKLLIWLLIIVLSFILISCWKTNINDLPEEERNKIWQDIMKNADTQWLVKKQMEIGFSGALSEEQKTIEADKINKEFLSKTIKYAQEKYPNIEFNEQFLQENTENK